MKSKNFIQKEIKHGETLAVLSLQGDVSSIFYFTKTTQVIQIYGAFLLRMKFSLSLMFMKLISPVCSVVTTKTLYLYCSSSNAS